MVWMEAEAFCLITGLRSLFSPGLRGPGKTCREAGPSGKAGGRGRRGWRAGRGTGPASKPRLCPAIGSLHEGHEALISSRRHHALVCASGTLAIVGPLLAAGPASPEPGDGSVLTGRAERSAEGLPLASLTVTFLSVDSRRPHLGVYAFGISGCEWDMAVALEKENPRDEPGAADVEAGGYAALWL